MNITVQLIDNKLCFYYGSPAEADELISEIGLDELFTAEEVNDDGVIYRAFRVCVERNFSLGFYDAPIEELNLTTRSLNCLLAENVKSIRDLLTCTETQLLRMPEFGVKSLEDVQRELRSHGFYLGMVLK